MNIRYMCTFKPTHSQYAHQRVVATIRDQTSFFDQWRSTHVSWDISYYAVILGNGYNVHQYITTRLLPFKVFSEERPWTDEEDW